MGDDLDDLIAYGWFIYSSRYEYIVYVYIILNNKYSGLIPKPFHPLGVNLGALQLVTVIHVD